MRDASNLLPVSMLVGELEAIADSLESCEWNHPAMSPESCRHAAKMLNWLRDRVYSIREELMHCALPSSILHDPEARRQWEARYDSETKRLAGDY